MSREDHGSHTEADAGRFARNHADDWPADRDYAEAGPTPSAEERAEAMRWAGAGMRTRLRPELVRNLCGDAWDEGYWEAVIDLCPFGTDQPDERLIWIVEHAPKRGVDNPYRMPA